MKNYRYQAGFIGAIAGSVVGGLFGARGARKQQRSSQGMAREQMDFQAGQAATARDFNERMVQEQRAYATEMSSTAHQRQVADLRAAGLNPLLSANSGASTPSSAAPSSPSPSGAMGQAQNIEGAAVGTGLDIYSRLAQIENVKADTRLKGEQGKALGVPSAVGETTQGFFDYLKQQGKKLPESISILARELENYLASDAAGTPNKKPRVGVTFPNQGKGKRLTQEEYDNWKE